MNTANTIYSKFGNVFALNLFAPLEEVHTDLVESVRYVGHVGNKTVHRYRTAPNSWGIQCKHQKPVHVELTEGSFFKPHRDLFHKIDNKWVRLNCFANHSHPEECTYVIDGRIQNFQEGRWYAMNPSLVHYSFCYAPETVHYIVDIDVSDSNTCDWLISNIQYCDRPLTGEGYK